MRAKEWSMSNGFDQNFNFFCYFIKTNLNNLILSTYFLL